MGWPRQRKGLTGERRQEEVPKPKTLPILVSEGNDYLQLIQESLGELVDLIWFTSNGSVEFTVIERNGSRHVFIYQKPEDNQILAGDFERTQQIQQQLEIVQNQLLTNPNYSHFSVNVGGLFLYATSPRK